MGRYSEGQKKNTSYVIERAVSGRSQCRICRNLIPEGQYRVGTPHPEYDSHRWHHLKCAVDRKMIKETTPLEGEESVWVKAALRAVDEHRARTGCDCDTFQLVSEGCRCGVSASDYHNIRPELPENALPMKNQSGIFQPGETIRGDFSQATAEVVSRKNFVPLGVNNDAFIEEEGIVEDDDAITAASVLAEAVQDAYFDAAQQVADAKARVEIAQKSFVPGMSVWGSLDHRPYILLERQDDNNWMVADTKNKKHLAHYALLTPYQPSRWQRFVSQFLTDSHYRLAVSTLVLLSGMVISLAGMGAALIRAMP